MKIFEKDGKINFVDDNNVFVGFDYSQDCCEWFGWGVYDSLPTSIKEGTNDIDVEDYQFDTTFYQSATLTENHMDDGGTAVFRLTKGDSEIFLMLFNCHNGYYGHGFSMTCDDKFIFEGCL